MKNKKLIIFIVLIILVNVGYLKAFGVPVWDAANFAKMAYISGQKILKWVKYIEKFNEYRKFFDTYQARFNNTIIKFKPGEIEILFGGVDIEVLLKVVESTAYDNVKYQSDIKKITNPELINYEFIKKTPIYNRKGNESLKEYIDIEIKRNTDQVNDYHDIMIKLNEIKKMEKELIEKKYKGYREKIEEFNSDDMSPNLLRAYVLINLIDMEILKLNYSMMIILRTYFEMDIKDSVYEMDSVMTKELYNAKK